MLIKDAPRRLLGQESPCSHTAPSRGFCFYPCPLLPLPRNSCFALSGRTSPLDFVLFFMYKFPKGSLGKRVTRSQALISTLLRDQGFLPKGAPPRTRSQTRTYTCTMPKSSPCSVGCFVFFVQHLHLYPQPPLSFTPKKMKSSSASSLRTCFHETGFSSSTFLL